MKCVTVCYNGDLCEVIVWDEVMYTGGFVHLMDTFSGIVLLRGCFVLGGEWEKCVEGWKPWWYVAITDMQVWCNAQGACTRVHNSTTAMPALLLMRTWERMSTSTLLFMCVYVFTWCTCAWVLFARICMGDTICQHVLPCSDHNPAATGSKAGL